MIKYVTYPNISDIMQRSHKVKLQKEVYYYSFDSNYKEYIIILSDVLYHISTVLGLPMSANYYIQSNLIIEICTTAVYVGKLANIFI